MTNETKGKGGRARTAATAAEAPAEAPAEAEIAGENNAGTELIAVSMITAQFRADVRRIRAAIDGERSDGLPRLTPEEDALCRRMMKASPLQPYRPTGADWQLIPRLIDKGMIQTRGFWPSDPLPPAVVQHRAPPEPDSAA